MIKVGKSKMDESAIYDQLRDAEDMDPVDKALTKYVLDPGYKYLLTTSIMKDAISEYGNEGMVTIYRGINFDTKEMYDAFIKSIKGGTLKSKGVTSWSPDKPTAQQFASTKPNYMEFMTKEDMSKISAARKSGEKITGYRGIILKTKISKGQGVDLRRFPHRSESEILLPVGTYKVTYEDILTYRDTVAGQGIDAFLAKIKPSDKDAHDKINYAVRNYKPEDLSDETRHKIYLLTKPKKWGHYVLPDELDSKWNPDPRIKVGFSLIDMELLPYYLPKDRDALRSGGKSEFKKLIDDLKKAWRPEYSIQWFYQHQKYADFFGLANELTKFLRSTIGKEYNKQDQIARDINKIKDPKARRDAIDAEAARIMKLLQSI